MRILVPLDGSSQAEQAMLPAMQLFRWERDAGELILVRVVPHPAAESAISGTVSPLVAKTLQDEAIAAANAYLAGIRQCPELQSMAVTTITEVGNPAHRIGVVAQRHHVDGIICTSRQHAALTHLTGTSVAEAVACTSHLPTVIVRPGWQTFPVGDRFVPFTLLVPLDGSGWAEQILPFAVRLAGLFDGVIRLLRVLPDWAHSDHARTQQAQAYLTTIQDRLRAQGITTHRDLAWGDPVEEIVAMVHQHQSDLILMATHAGSAFSHLVGGSVPVAVLHRVHIPVALLCPAQATP